MGVSFSIPAPEHLSLYVISLSGLLFLTLRTAVKRLTLPPLPPGPTPWPLIGNISDFPNEHEGRFWSKHKELYGPISCVTAMGRPYIILNDTNAAIELLDKRSAYYSSRHENTFSGKLVNVTRYTVFLPFGPELKRHRKLIQTYIGTVASMQWIEMIEKMEARRLLFRLLSDPSKYCQHVRTYSAAVILKISHGYNIEPEGVDPLVENAENVLQHMLFPAIAAGKWVVDILPFLQYLPSWLPGMSFKRTARLWNNAVTEFENKPYAFVQKQMAEGKDKSSFVSYNIEKGLASNENDEATLRHAASQLFAAGADTTVSLLMTFFLAMTLFPEVQRKAQAEVDRVVGNDRLPEFADRDDLPYISALIKELFRWEQVTPNAIPHLCTQEDTYAGYRIPKGAVVIPNTWQMSRDPEVYKDPSTVIPDRFLGENPEPDPYIVAFGFGRRVCPGKRMADSSLFISIALLLATFDISKAVDEDGRVIIPRCEYTHTPVSLPKPFRCSLTPRSKKAEELIRSVLDDHPFEKGDADVLKRLSLEIK